MSKQDIELAKKIGVHERTIRKWSPAKREQWEALANDALTNYDTAYFDLLSQLVFNIAVLSARNGRYSASVSIGAASSFMLHDHVAPSAGPVASIPLRSADDILAALTELEKYA